MLLLINKPKLKVTVESTMVLDGTFTTILWDKVSVIAECKNSWTDLNFGRQSKYNSVLVLVIHSTYSLKKLGVQKGFVFETLNGHFKRRNTFSTLQCLPFIYFQPS